MSELQGTNIEFKSVIPKYLLKLAFTVLSFEKIAEERRKYHAKILPPELS